jgi:ATP-dependent Lon protease
MATALVSALTGRKVRRDVAMTGEITLRGKVLPIGGLKEKMLAAHRAGISTFVLPGKNKKDLADIPSKVLRQIQVVPADDLDKVLDVALRPAPNLSDPINEPTPEPQPKPVLRPKPPAPRRTSISGIPAS